MLNGDDEEEQLYSDEEENDDGFDDDMEALRRACTLAGTNVDEITTHSPSASSAGTEIEKDDENDGVDDGNSSDDDDDNDDFELFRNIKNRFSIPMNDYKEPLSLKPLCALPPDFDDNEDNDFETLRAVQRRFAAYENSGNLRRGVVEKREGTEGCKVFPDTEEGALTINNKEIQLSGIIEQQPMDDDHDLPCMEITYSSSFPKSAQVFLDAIKRNRSCQNFLRSKMTHIAARIEENNKLKENVKILRDLQVSCRKITGRALAQGKDPRIQLISAQRTSNSRDSKVNDKNVSAMYDGPMENSHTAKFRKALESFPVTLKHKKWTEEEKENLRNGIRQQFQETVLQFSVDQLSASEESLRDVNNVDVIHSSIRDMEITPEMLRDFLPKVNWDQLASLYVVNRTGAECEAQWVNNEDPLINHGKWTAEEEKKLLFIVQKKGMTNWFSIAASLGRNRTPFQCLAHFQRSLNARIIGSDWTKEEDAQLCIAVETFGENNWQSVASTLEGRTGPQCSNRWKKTLHPSIFRNGRWTLDEKKRLKVAVMLLGPRNWGKIAQFVPGRTGVKCRERWVNCEDPSLNTNEWTEEEDSRLKAAIEEFGYCWSKVAKRVTPRTDNECRRRWKALFPHEVPLLQAARRTKKAAIISNFVDRESERPALGPHDFVPPPMIQSVSESENMNKSGKHKREGTKPRKDKKAAPRNSSKRDISKRPKGGMQISSTEDLGITNGTVVEKFGGNDSVVTKRRLKPCLVKNCDTKLSHDHPDPNVLAVTNGEQDDLVGQPDTSSKVSKLPFKRKIDMESAECNIEKSSSDGIFPSKVSKDPKCTSDGNIESSREGQLVASVPCQHERQKRPKLGSKSCSERVLDTNNKDATFASLAASVPYQHGGNEKSKFRSKSCGKRVLDTSNEDNLTLASFMAKVPREHNRGKRSKLRNKSFTKCASGMNDEDDVRLTSSVSPVPYQPERQKQSEVRSKSYSKRVLDVNDEDNDTIASFLESKSKKRRIQAFGNDNGTSSPSSTNGSKH